MMATTDPQSAEKQEYTELIKALGAHIRALRKERGWTLRDMVVHHGFHLSAWQGYEAGRFGMSIPSLVRVAKALGMRPSELLAAVDEKLLGGDQDAGDAPQKRPARKRIGAAKRR